MSDKERIGLKSSSDLFIVDNVFIRVKQGIEADGVVSVDSAKED